MVWLTNSEISALGLKCGKGVLVSSRASLYGCSNIEIGDYSRIDDFCVLSAGEGGISIGRNVHVAIYSSLVGSASIVLNDFSGLSSHVSIYSSSDDYSGQFMTNPTVNPEFTNVKHANVCVGRHVIIGSGSVVLPGVTLAEGAAIGALSLVNKDCDPFTVYTGNPIRRLKARSQKLLDLEAQFLRKYPNQ